MVRQYLKDYYQKHKEEIKARSTTLYNFMREKVKEILGDKCYICNITRKRMVTHEIHGKPHPYGGTRGYKYILDHPQDFVILCAWHHDAVHNVLKFPEIIELSKGILRSKGASKK